MHKYRLWGSNNNNSNGGSVSSVVGEKITSAIETTWRPLTKTPAKSSALFFFFIFLFAAAFLATRLLDNSIVTKNSVNQSALDTTSTFLKYPHKIPKVSHKTIEVPLNCTIPINQTILMCPINYPTTFQPEEDQDRSLCPDYYRWIHEDLRPWKVSGITPEMIRRAQRTANFRLTVVNGIAYVERYRKSFQSRDTFTLWGILQLLRKYPGKVPDLDMMFDCVDWPVVPAKLYSGLNATAPPPVFRYCGDDASLDIVFPDWSFWGWPEIHIKPWDSLLNELEEGNKRTKWLEREPHAYWKGNPTVAETRMDLMKCNVSEQQDWGAHVYAQDWAKESRQGFKQSDLASQCNYRYKVYIEGSAWSVSEKYILACNSLTLLVKPRYYDFFTRNLMPMQHYWPIKDNDKCRSIKFAVDWGNSHKKKAQSFGKAASKYILEDIKMDYVYDYMFHLLNEYAKLLKFKPTKPPRASELCSESMACSDRGLERQFMLDSIVKGPSYKNPCTMPPPYDLQAMKTLKLKKENAIKKVENWEKIYWANYSNKQH